MSDEEIAELLKYSSPNELYIVTQDNLLKLLICPFKVVLLVEIGGLNKGNIYYVEEVKITRGLVTVYLIKGQAYFYYHFDFVLE